MPPDFQRTLVITLIAGAAIALVGVTTLLVAFRRFGARDAGSSSHIALIAGLVAFVFACCLVFFALSYAR